MDLKLVVLAGAKEGLEIPLKKDKFLIGRAKECALRAGSEAISRRHCAIIRIKDIWAVRDLGSRNGTYVNDTKIEQPVKLRPGDELRVGPLKFRIASIDAAAKPKADAANTPTESSKPRKQPPVQGVGDVVQRSSKNTEGSMSEDDISRWLLDMPDMNSEETLKETRTIRLEETATHKRSVLGTESTSTVEDIDGIAGDSESESVHTEEGQPAAEESHDENSKSGGWNLFKRGKSASQKPKPGKLPPRTDQATKDSREAAADLLREMQRRR